LQQSSDSLLPEDIHWEVVSETHPTHEQYEALKFAWRCVKHTKSNAITVATQGRLLGMGSGQPNRVNSVRIALEKAGDEAEGSVLASDAFFPFAWGDSVEKACQAGVKAIAHPGGSMRDQDAIDCCNKYGVALLTTGHRHFRH
jgi:phosphoribosylaminoimidazolecarboxamide formyltransferase/IMP cyclohydrolase